MHKSTADEIRQRFDADVERFSNLETGQTAAMDAALAMELIAEAAAKTTPHAVDILDVGCGAGNYTLKLLQHRPGLNVTLVDLSRPMLNRAVERIQQAGGGRITAIQNDIRRVSLEKESFDVILAAAVLHHLRTEDEWREVFTKLHDALRPGGAIWIFDMIQSDLPSVQTIEREQYGRYLAEFKDEAYRDHVFNYIEKEDTPRPLMFQLDLLRAVGFQTVDVLHKHCCFAAFGGVK